MYDDIEPGSRINLKVTKQPTNAAAVKTIVRLLGKDEQVRVENNRLAKVRKKAYNPRRRGGRLYGGRQVKLRPVKARPPEQGTITATADVLADLKSVSRFIEVTAV